MRHCIWKCGKFYSSNQYFIIMIEVCFTEILHVCAVCEIKLSNSVMLLYRSAVVRFNNARSSQRGPVSFGRTSLPRTLNETTENNIWLHATIMHCEISFIHLCWRVRQTLIDTTKGIDRSQSTSIRFDICRWRSAPMDWVQNTSAFQLACTKRKTRKLEVVAGLLLYETCPKSLSFEFKLELRWCPPICIIFSRTTFSVTILHDMTTMV